MKIQRVDGRGGAATVDIWMENITAAAAEAATPARGWSGGRRLAGPRMGGGEVQWSLRDLGTPAGTFGGRVGVGGALTQLLFLF